MTAAIDPVSLELINSKVTGVVAEMRVVLFHSGYSTVLRESEDGSVGLLDAKLRTVATSKKLPLHFGSFSAIADHLPRYYKPGDLEEGDVILFNNPYEGNVTHPADTITLMPVFVDGALVAHTASLAHKPDLGGPRSAGAARDIWEEGLVIPPIKFHIRGEANPEIERLIAANSRLPLEIMGDLRGQVAACRAGARRIQELCARFGAERVTAGFEALMALVARRLREELKSFPDGIHMAEALLDHDGLNLDRPLRIHLAVSKKGDEILFDFSESDPQAQGPVNVTPALIRNTCYFGLMAITDPNLPFNQGFVEVAKARFKEGTIVCPRPGASVSNYVPTVYLTSDVVLKALGEFCPDKAVGSAGGGAGIQIRGLAPASGKPWMLMELLDTALGATQNADGISLIHGTLGMGQFRPGPIEIHETEFPLRVTRFDVRTDSGGPGKFRGGLGCIREYQVLEAATVPVRSAQGGQRRKLPPWGVFGGGPARAGSIFVNDVEVPDHLYEITLKPGDVLRVELNSGGGYGDALDRDPELVLGDGRDGYVTLQGARDDYSVVISPKTLKLDPAATAALRRKNSTA